MGNSIRVNPINSNTRAPRIKYTHRINRINICEAKRVSDLRWFNQAVDSQFTNSHLKKYLNYANRRYTYFEDYGEYWLKPRYSKLFHTDVNHIFTKHGRVICIQAVLMKSFSEDEVMKINPYLNELNKKDCDVTFLWGYNRFPSTVLSVAKEFVSTNTAMLSSLKKILNIPINTYFEEEDVIYDYIYSGNYTNTDLMH